MTPSGGTPYATFNTSMDGGGPESEFVPMEGVEQSAATYVSTNFDAAWNHSTRSAVTLVEIVLTSADGSSNKTLSLATRDTDTTSNGRHWVGAILDPGTVQAPGAFMTSDVSLCTQTVTLSGRSVVGVNGTGKTTTIAKLAAKFQKQKKTVMLAAADTFRAAAIDQLEVWAQRLGTEIVRHQPGGDPAAVLFDSIRAARARNVGVVIADTAGRLHTQRNLMEELKKVDRVVQKELGRAPDETLLVLDATTGQNALTQAQQFKEAIGLTGIVMTKLDGTAKGGMIITIAEEMQLPIKLIGVGEKAEDIEPFDPDKFVDALIE